MDVVHLNSLDHVIHQSLASDIYTPNGADVVECFKHARLTLVIDTSEETNDTDCALELDALQTLSKSSRATHFDNVVDTDVVGSQRASDFAPVGVRLVVNDMIRSKLLELLGLRIRGGRSNNSSSSCFSELFQGYCQLVRCSSLKYAANISLKTYLQGKHANTARSLYQDDLTRLKRVHTIQSIPTGESSARKGTRLDEVQIPGSPDQAIFVENTVLAQSTIKDTTETGFGAPRVDRTVLVVLIEQGHHLVAFLELGHFRPDLDDLAGTIGTGDNGQIEREGIHPL